MSSHYTIEISFFLRPDVTEDTLNALRFVSSGELEAIQRLKSLPAEIAEALQCKHEDAKFDYMPGTARTHVAYVFNHSKGGTDYHYHTVNFRHYIREAFLFNFGYSLLAWFASVSIGSGFVGYLHNISDTDPELIYFQDGALETFDLKTMKKVRVTFEKLLKSE